MGESKTIKGQAWINNVVTHDEHGNEIIKSSLVQDQILVVPGVDSFSNTVCLVDDIWEDLTSASGQYKTNGKGYFYWEYQQTLMDDPDLEVTIKYECPRPKEGLFEEPYDPESVEGDYAKYWVEKFKIATENYEYKIAIQKKEVIFPRHEYLDWETGKFKEVDEIRVKNNDLGDIENLLNLY